MKKFFLPSSQKRTLVNIHFRKKLYNYIFAVPIFATFSFFFNYITLIYAQKHYKYLLNEKKK